MSNKLFRREASVTFGIRGEPGRKVSGLRISFDIDATSESNANGARISIWNLSAQSRAILESEAPRFVSLEVGYADRTGVLFSGDVRDVRHESQQGGMVTVIHAGDREQDINTAKIEKNYDEGVGVKQIIKDIIKTFSKTGEVIEGTLDQLKDKTYQNGFSLAGMSKDLLDNLVRALGGAWSIQNGKIQVTEKGRSIGGTALLLTPKTGLIGTPVKRSGGVDFTHLIQPEFLGAGRAVAVESRSVSGTFVTRRVKYTGDTHALPWYASVEADEI